MNQIQLRNIYEIFVLIHEIIDKNQGKNHLFMLKGILPFC